MNAYRWLNTLLVVGTLLGCDDGGGSSAAAGDGSADSAGGDGSSVGSGGQAGAENPGGATGGMTSSTSGGASGEGGESGSGGTGGATMPDAGPPIDESEELYDEANLPRFDITLPQSSIDALAAAPDTYAPGELRYGDEVVSNIGVRIKGEYSFRELDKKSALKLKFDALVARQTFRGLRRMTFNNMIEDPSFIAERLAYVMYRAAGLPAPRCNSALVYVNDQFFGVYANVETEDKTFLRRWFDDEDGNLYEEGQRDFERAAVDSFDLETNEMANDRSDLIHLVEVFEATTPDMFLADMDAVLDIDHFLRFTAIEGLVNQWDMYGYTRFYPNNFRVYSDPTTGRFVFLPWGMDMSMKPYNDLTYIAMFEVANNTIVDTSGRMFVRCLESAACRAQYVATVEDMLEVYEAADLEAKAEAYFEQIREHIELDPRKEVNMTYVEEFYGHVLANIRGRADAVRLELAEERN